MSKEMVEYKETSSQDVFNIVAKHLFNQGKQCLDIYGNCAYRGANGMKCAVGALILDSEYSFVLEGKNVHNILHDEQLCRTRPYLKQLFKEHIMLLTRLQMIHDDTWAWVSEITLKDALYRAAKDFHLDGSILGELHFPIQEKENVDKPKKKGKRT